MALPAGTRLGPYEIVSYIGAGAMGVVYKSRDTRLGRFVAIKVLPPAFARDPDRLSRFEREARAVAAINHPNIVSVHDIGGADVVDDEKGPMQAAFLVTELLDGDTLRARLDAGPLTARKSADVAMQVARGLAAAHDRGIVHRDLKPENIVLLRDGLVKILDFGLAKQSTAGGEQETIAGTDAGTILGTVGYMAPEQVRGEAAGPRSDLFALGAVLYELTTGRRLFARPSAAETMTAILHDEPPPLTAAAAEPAAAGLDRIIRHAVEKEPDERFQSARDFAFALQAFNDTSGSGTSAVGAPAANAARRRPRERAAWTAAAILAVVAAAAVAWPRTTAAPTGAPVVFSPTLPWRDASLASPAVSPDGRRIAFIAHDRGDEIVIRSVDALQAQPLKGTNGARSGGVFWSPDGESLGFFAGGKLQVIALATGQVDEIADAPSAYGGTWGRDGTILFSPDERAPIFRVNAAGGAVTRVTTLDPARHDEAHRWPQFLPDGRHFVFMPWTLGAATRRIQLASLDGGPPTPLFESESAAVVAGSYYVFARDIPSRLNAQPFNPTTFLPDGRPLAVVDDDNIDYWWQTGEPEISGSATTLIYTTGKYRVSRLTWFSRTGQPLGVVGDADVYYDPTLSPDGTSLVVEKRDPDRKGTDLWTVDLARGTFSRLTSTPGFESVGTWSPDGRRVAYAADLGDVPNVWVKNAGGTGAEEIIVKGRAIPTDWSPDGRFLLYMIDGGTTREDVWAYDTAGHTSTAVLASPFNEASARFSPDAKWIAYESDETRSPEVYVRSFPDAATKIQVSTDGGEQPQWRRDGKELFYLAPDTTLMAVDVQVRGATLVVGTPRPLFVTNANPNYVMRNVYSPSVDGQRFLLMSMRVPRDTSPLVGVLNWAAGLRK
jgi:Tol biopolymer transport system component